VKDGKERKKKILIGKKKEIEIEKKNVRDIVNVKMKERGKTAKTITTIKLYLILIIRYNNSKMYQLLRRQKLFLSCKHLERALNLQRMTKPLIKVSISTFK
jgi:hypothetical protein